MCQPNSIYLSIYLSISLTLNGFSMKFTDAAFKWDIYIYIYIYIYIFALSQSTLASLLYLEQSTKNVHILMRTHEKSL